MFTSRRFPIRNVLVPMLGFALAAASCRANPPHPVTTRVAPSPTRAAPTARPTAVPTKAPTRAPTASPTLSNQPTPSGEALGVKGTAGNLSLTPTKAQIITSVGTQKPKQGDVYWVVSLTLQNASSKDSLSFDPQNLLVVAAESNISYPSVSIKSVAGELGYQTLTPNAQRQGVLVYEVPQNLTYPELEYKGTGGKNLIWILHS